MMQRRIERTRQTIKKYSDIKHGLEITYKIRRLIKLGAAQQGFVIDGKRYNSGDEVDYEDWVSRSIIYTLFLSNIHSAALISNLDRTSISFHYPDAQLIIRSMLERTIHQRFIMSDPNRLAHLFILWRQIEWKRYLRGIELVQKDEPDSIALQRVAGRSPIEWTAEDEEDFQRTITNWENLVIPKQKAEKARTWSGLSLASMAEKCGLIDYYRIKYRTSSWFTHGLINVSDFYLKESNDKPGLWMYSIEPDEDQKIECYIDALEILELSFYTADDFLKWDVSDEVAKIITEEPRMGTWLVELFSFFRGF